MTGAKDSLSELQFHFSNDVITLSSLKAHTSLFSESPNECFLQRTCTNTTLAPSEGYGNIPQRDVRGKAVHGTSQAQRFAWMAGLGRLFANLTEWGQRFMATPGPLERLGAFLLVFTPNKKQFPLFKGTFFFSVLED